MGSLTGGWQISIKWYGWLAYPQFTGYAEYIRFCHKEHLNPLIKIEVSFFSMHIDQHRCTLGFFNVDPTYWSRCIHRSTFFDHLHHWINTDQHWSSLINIKTLVRSVDQQSVSFQGHTCPQDHLTTTDTQVDQYFHTYVNAKGGVHNWKKCPFIF